MKKEEKSAYELMFEEVKNSNSDLKDRMAKLNDGAIDKAKLDVYLRYAIRVAGRAHSMKYTPFAKSVRIALQEMCERYKTINESIARLENGSEQFKKDEAEKNRHTFTFNFKSTRVLYIVLFVTLAELISIIIILIIEFSRR